MIHQLPVPKAATRRCWNNDLDWYCRWPAQWPIECKRCGDGHHNKLLRFWAEFIPKTVQDLKQIAEGKIRVYA